MSTLYEKPITLATLAYSVASELKSIREGFITSAGIINMIDSNRIEADNYWRYGPFWVLNANNGSAPTGEYGTVASFQNGTAVLSSSLNATVPSGSRYAIGRRRYPLDVIIQCINSAYQELGNVPLADTTLTTLATTREYTIPQAVRGRLLEVWVQTEDTYPAIHGYIKIPAGQWRQELDTLYLPQLSTTAYTIKLIYADSPPLLVSYNDELSDYVHPLRIVFKAAASVLMWRGERINDTSISNAINQRVNYFLDMDQKAKYSHPIRIPHPQDLSALAGMDYAGGRGGIRVNVPPGQVSLK